MKIFSRLFKSKQTKKTLSSKYGDNLTKYEIALIIKNRLCPDCGKGELLDGPRGGCSINVLCSNDTCASKFNLSFGYETIIAADRISERSSGAKRQ